MRSNKTASSKTHTTGLHLQQEKRLENKKKTWWNLFSEFPTKRYRISASCHSLYHHPNTYKSPWTTSYYVTAMSGNKCDWVRISSSSLGLLLPQSDLWWIWLLLMITETFESLLSSQDFFPYYSNNFSLGWCFSSLPCTICCPVLLTVTRSENLFDLIIMSCSNFYSVGSQITLKYGELSKALEILKKTFNQKSCAHCAIHSWIGTTFILWGEDLYCTLLLQ
jgi:predicted nucleic-acid-binding Zn-ribbon protein